MSNEHLSRPFSPHGPFPSESSPEKIDGARTRRRSRTAPDGARRSLAMLLLLTVALSVTGCHKWSRVTHPPVASTDTAMAYDRVRLHRTDRSVTMLYDARIRRDSVVGYSVPRAMSGARRRAVSRDEIERIERRKGDPLGTALTVTGVALGAGFLTFAIVCSVSDCFDISFGDWSW